MRCILVGEAPNPATVGRSDLWLLPDDSGISHTANRLLDFTGWTLPEFLAIFVRRDNVLTVPPALRWTKLHRQIAVDRARELFAEADRDGLRIVALGRKAADSFSSNGLRPCEWSPVLGLDPPRPALVRVAYLPHTSGLNPWWRNAENRILARGFFAELAQ